MSASVIGALRVNLGLDSAHFIKGTKDAQNALQKAGREMQRIGAAISVVGAGIATAVSIKASQISDIGKLATVANTSVEEFQRFAAAAGTVNLEAEKMADILKDVSDRVGDFITTGGGPMADFFENIAPKVGITADAFRDLSGADALQLYVSSLEKAGVSQNEMVFYLEAMAGDASALIPLLRDNGAELNRLGDAAERSGAIFSQEAAEGAQKFTESMGLVKSALGGLVTQITTALLPVMESFASIAASFAEQFGQLSPEIQRASAVFAGLTVVVGPLLVALGLIVTAVGAISAPVLLAVAAIAALTAGLVAFWPQITAATEAAIAFVRDGIAAIGEAMDSAATAMRDGMDRGVAWVKASFDELIAYFTSLPGRFKEFGTNIIQGLTDGITERWSSLKSRVTGIFSGITDGARDLFKIQSPSKVFHEIGGFLIQGLTGGIMDSASAPVAAIGRIGNDIGTSMSNAATTLQSTFQDAFTSFVTGASSAKEAVGQLLSSLSKMAANAAFQGLFGGGMGGGSGGGIFKNLLGGIFGGGGVKVPTNVLAAAASFSGGGYTGNGARSGGIDGEGGFPAILHPRETVIDHTKGQTMPGGGTSVNVSFNIDARGSVEGEGARFSAYMRQAAPEIQRSVMTAIQSKRGRGHPV